MPNITMRSRVYSNDIEIDEMEVIVDDNGGGRYSLEITVHEAQVLIEDLDVDFSDIEFSSYDDQEMLDALLEMSSADDLIDQLKQSPGYSGETGMEDAMFDYLLGNSITDFMMKVAECLSRYESNVQGRAATRAVAEYRTAQEAEKAEREAEAASRGDVDQLNSVENITLTEKTEG